MSPPSKAMEAIIVFSVFNIQTYPTSTSPRQLNKYLELSSAKIRSSLLALPEYLCLNITPLFDNKKGGME